MSRRDYVAVASAIAQSRDWAADNALSDVVLDDAAERIADAFSANNPRFDRGRFLTAARGE